MTVSKYNYKDCYPPLAKVLRCRNELLIMALQIEETNNTMSERVSHEETMPPKKRKPVRPTRPPTLPPIRPLPKKRKKSFWDVFF
jgi:hypothetical protein